MKLILFSLFTLAFSIPTYAQVTYDITCKDNNCWTSGWTLKDHHSGTFSEVECKDNNCFQNGWIQVFRGQITSNATCKETGCWVDGADFFDEFGQKTGGIACNEDPNLGNNCLTAGWRMIGQFGQTTGEVFCIADDCEKFGWDIDYFHGPLQIVRCKNESCFTNGWTLRQ